MVGQVSMRLRLAMLLLLVACGDRAAPGASTSSAPTSVELAPSVAAAAGDKTKYERTQTVVLSSELELGGQKVTTSSEETQRLELTEECLAVRDDRCVRTKLSFGKAFRDKVFRATAPLNEPQPEPQHQDQPFAEQSFVLELPTEDRVEVQLEAGGAAPEPLAAQVRAQYEDVTRSTRLTSVVPTTLRVGDELPDLAKHLAESASDPRADRQAQARVAVRGIRADGDQRRVSLSVEQTSTTRAGGAAIEVELKGTLVLDAHGARVLEQRLKGPIRIQDGEGTLSGTMTETVTCSYAR